jgi:ribosomal protein S18 acetylase RimI-like enzyme
MPNNNIIIEQVTTFSKDIAEVIKRLASKIGQNYKILSDEDIQSMLASPNTNILIAMDTEKKSIVGMATLLVYRIPYVKKSSIEDVIVDEVYRGRGVASKLMNCAVTLAQEKGAAYVDLTARPRRAESNNLYAKLGFKKRETNVYRKIIDYGEV